MKACIVYREDSLCHVNFEIRISSKATAGLSYRSGRQRPARGSRGSDRPKASPNRIMIVSISLARFPLQSPVIPHHHHQIASRFHRQNSRNTSWRMAYTVYGGGGFVPIAAGTNWREIMYAPEPNRNLLAGCVCTHPLWQVTDWLMHHDDHTLVWVIGRR